MMLVMMMQLMQDTKVLLHTIPATQSIPLCVAAVKDLQLGNNEKERCGWTTKTRRRAKPAVIHHGAPQFCPLAAQL